MVIDSVKSRLLDIRQQTKNGFYAKVNDVRLSDDTIVLTVTLPDGGTTEHRLSIPTYWEEGRELVEFLDNIDIELDEFEEIENRALPVEREGGSWDISDSRIASGDYTVTSVITAFDITDLTKNNTVNFEIVYDIAPRSDVSHAILRFDAPEEWADDEYELSELSGTFDAYSEGGATGEFTISLTVVSDSGEEIEKSEKTVVAEE